MTLSEESKERVEAEVRRMIGELRAKQTQEKEDRLGVEIARLAPEEREYVKTVLLRIVAEERAGEIIRPAPPGRRRYSWFRR